MTKENEELHPLNWVMDGDQSPVIVNGQLGKIVGHTSLTLHVRVGKGEYEDRTTTHLLVESDDVICAIHESRVSSPVELPTIRKVSVS